MNFDSVDTFTGAVYAIYKLDKSSACTNSYQWSH